MQRQLRNFREKHRRLPKDFFELGIPKYRSLEFTTEADDSISNGQFKKLRVDVERCRYTLSIKLPVSWKSWKWFEIEQNLPRKVADLLKAGAVLKAPSIVKRRRKCGREYYALKFVLEMRTRRLLKESGRVLGVDLSPSVSRLAVCVVYGGDSHSRPICLSAKRLVRKAMRIQKEIDRLEHKIDEAYRRKDFARLRHLFGEQKRRRHKLKAIRKQMLEVFVSELILLAKQNNCFVIAVENLSGIRVPNWRSKVLRYLFSSWFHGKVAERLKHKAARHGIRIVAVNPKNTSRLCHVCGSKLSGSGLYIRCKTCNKTWDRDYNAAVNIARKALDRLVSRGQPEGLDSGGVRQHKPSRLTPRLHAEVNSDLPNTTLLAWLCVVRISLLAHLCRNKKAGIGKR